MAAGGRRRRGSIFIILALILILIMVAVGFLLRDQITRTIAGGGGAQTLPTATPVQNLVKILVLAQPVSRGTLITEAMLASIDYPQSAMIVDGTNELFFREERKQEIIDRKLRARYDLQNGVPLTEALLTDRPMGSYASNNIEKGKVAISIPMNRLSSVSYGLYPGDRVNVIASILLVDIDASFQSRLPNYSAQITAPGPASPEGGPTTLGITVTSGGAASTQGRAELDTTLNQAIYVLPSEPQRPRLVSQTLVQDAMVLWVGEFPGGDVDLNKPTPTPPPPAEGQPAPAAPARPDIVTLVVSPQDAVTLNYLMLAGANLNIVLRSAGDTQATTTQAVTLQYVLDQYGIPYPAKLPYGLEPRLDLLPPTLQSASSQPAPVTTGP